MAKFLSSCTAGQWSKLLFTRASPLRYFLLLFFNLGAIETQGGAISPSPCMHLLTHQRVMHLSCKGGMVAPN